MISAKEAVELANKYSSDIFNKVGTVEEVEVDGKYWLITLGYSVPKTDINESDRFSTGLLSAISFPKFEKEYKTFRINGETNEFSSAKIYKF